MILIGYGGHAFVAYGIIESSAGRVTGYCDGTAKPVNPFNLPYIGSEDAAAARLRLIEEGFFIAIGDNSIRKKVAQKLEADGLVPNNIIHPSAVISAAAVINGNGIMISAGVLINPLARVQDGAICNTGCIIEHECRVGAWAHIGPGAVLCGNVNVGAGTFIGAGAIIRQGIQIGENCIVGAGAVVVKDVPGSSTVLGVPAKPQ
ncbi:MAG: acetyltransferase [Ferruginibacter sp.]